MSEKSTFVYVIYIQSTPEKVFEALTKPEFTRQYWCETVQETDWKPGSSWKLKTPDGRSADEGEIIEFDPPRRLVLSWQHMIQPDMKADGPSRATIELEPVPGGATKLTLTHENDVPNSKFIKAISNGWPAILSSMKSLLETGQQLEVTRHWPKGM